MVYLQKHSEEIYWLNRRIIFLKMLDDMLKKEATHDEFIEAAIQFKKIENPSDIVERLKEIYGKKLP